MSGILYIVATPIGNLADISFRAVETLQQVDLIAAEDTRHSRHLLTHYSINTKMLALHEHNEVGQAKKLIDFLQQGQSVALISDAGTPLISDPGYRLLQQAQQAQIRIVPIPGACALIAALSVAGLASDRFIFEGFLPSKQGARLKKLQTLQHETRTLIFYEAPHRILACLADMAAVFGEQRIAAIARELTKTFETVISQPLVSLHAQLEKNAQQQKGEFVLLVSGIELEKNTISTETKHILQILSADLPKKQAAKLAAEITGVSKNSLYQYLISQ